MPNRSASERESEYQELVAGHSPHKGIIDLTPEPSQPPQSAKTQPLPDLAPTAKIGLLERVYNLFGHRRN